jgi:hypothetical protein
MTKHTPKPRKSDIILEAGVRCCALEMNGYIDDTTENKTKIRCVAGIDGLANTPSMAHARVWFTMGSPCFACRLFTELAVTAMISTINDALLRISQPHGDIRRSLPG